jgi:hypothetical protein
MIKKVEIIEHKLFTEVTVWMGQDFSESVVTYVTILDVISQ